MSPLDLPMSLPPESMYGKKSNSSKTDAGGDVGAGVGRGVEGGGAVPFLT